MPALHFNGGLRVDTDSRFPAVLVKRLSGNWEAWKNGLLKLAYAEAFRAPSWDESNDSAAGRIAANVSSTPNGEQALVAQPGLSLGTPLRPETVKSIDASVQQKFGSHRLLVNITAIQNTKDIPVFMMVSPTPELMKVVDGKGNAPANLFGVGETLGYIDTSFLLIPKLVKTKGDKLRVGMIYNQSEPQSAEALHRIEQLAAGANIELVSFPVNSTSEVQLITKSLLGKNIDAFFANPDNTVFGSFETILKACNDNNVPVFTSEAGLVARGAIAAYGADIYQWGYQAGEQAALFLKNKSTNGLHWEMVKVRKRVYNKTAAAKFNITVPEGFDAI